MYIIFKLCLQLASISYYPVGGRDIRILTAINIAQWDIPGKALGIPVYRFLCTATHRSF